MVTSYDVAREAGVSQATVSRVINGNPRVDHTSRARVLDALNRLGWVPNASAKAMSTARAGAIGLVASEMANPYFPYLLDAVTRAAKDRGLTVIVWNDDEDDAPMAHAGVASGAVDGVMFAAARTTTTGIDALAERGVPVIAVSRASPHSVVDTVTSDHEGSAEAAATFLLERGRHDIAGIFGDRAAFASPARERGFRRALDIAGISVPESRWLVGETSYQQGWLAVDHLLADGALPDTLYCAADVIGYGALARLREAGIRVPDDVWVMGTDGLPMSGWSIFDLTTMEQPVTTMAETAVDLLLRRIDDPKVEHEDIRLPLTLKVRGTTG
jgi:LacI family transcriptional regulator